MENYVLKLIPINEVEKEENVFELPLTVVQKIAFLATTLTPIDSWEVIDGYTTALFEHMQEIKFKEEELFKSYDKLIHATNGFNLLKICIEFFLLEKDMRTYGISDEYVTRHNHLQIEYQMLLMDLKK